MEKGIMVNNDFLGNGLNETNEGNNITSLDNNYDSKSYKSTDLKVLVVAWVVVLLASSFSLILWREFGLGEPLWWPYITFFILLGFFVLSLVVKDFKSLRSFIAIILIIFLFGFGGGWQWGIIPWVRNSIYWIDWTNSLPWALSSLMIHLLRLTPAIAVLIYLFSIKRKRKDFFLVKGEIKALVEPSRLLGMKEPKPWTNIGSIFAIIFTVGTLIFLLVSQTPTLDDFFGVLPLLPVAILIAAMNAFNEEFTLRAAPLSELWKKLGKKHALLLTTVYFGLGHFYGVPSGILGVLLSAFLGWFLGKSLLETKGFFWAWIIHFFPDIVIFTFYAMFP